MAKYYFPPLRYLNANRTRVAILDAQIAKLKTLTDKMKKDVPVYTSRFGDSTAYIHSTGSHSDPTEYSALTEMPDDVSELLNDIRRMTIERHRTAARIDLAEQALAFLPERERLIVQFRTVDSMSWEDVVDALYEQTGTLICDKTARHTYDRGCEKIAPFFSAGDTMNEVSL